MSEKNLVTMKDILARASMSRSKFYEVISPTHENFDPEAPKPIKIGERSVRFVEGEVNAWIDALIQRGRRQTSGKDVA